MRTPVFTRSSIFPAPFRLFVLVDVLIGGAMMMMMMMMMRMMGAKMGEGACLAEG